MYFLSTYLSLVNSVKNEIPLKFILTLGCHVSSLEILATSEIVSSPFVVYNLLPLNIADTNITSNFELSCKCFLHVFFTHTHTF